jgi:hypothetical protein
MLAFTADQRSGGTGLSSSKLILLDGVRFITPCSHSMSPDVPAHCLPDWSHLRVRVPARAQGLFHQPLPPRLHRRWHAGLLRHSVLRRKQLKLIYR